MVNLPINAVIEFLMHFGIFVGVRKKSTANEQDHEISVDNWTDGTRLTFQLLTLPFSLAFYYTLISIFLYINKIFLETVISYEMILSGIVSKLLRILM